MNKKDQIFVAGHKGMVGSAIYRKLKKDNYENIIVASHSELSLDNEKEVEEFFLKNKIDYIFLAAAKVGGIMANINNGAEAGQEVFHLHFHVLPRKIGIPLRPHDGKMVGAKILKSNAAKMKSVL